MVALAIPLGIYMFFHYSQEEADRQVKEYEASKKDHPDSSKITVDNYELKEVDDTNQLRWQLLAHQGIMEPVTKDVDLHEVMVSYYDKKKLKMRISAPVGVANERSRLVVLDAAGKQRVIAEGEDGKAHMEAAKVELKGKNNFVATGGVNITWPGVAKVTGNTATGSLEKSAELKNFKIVGNTHALIGQM